MTIIECSISEIKDLLKTHYVEIDSPDGYVSVSEFIDKGEWDEYELTTIDDVVVLVNEDHLFETINGWTYAKNMLDGPHIVLTDNGYKSCIVRKTGNKIPIVDIQVEHENHRYYANGISSHNTNVGKSLGLCSLAADYIRDGYNVLYISFEMREELVLQRVDANILNVPANSLKDIPKEKFMDRVEAIRQKSYGQLVVKEFPPSSASSLNIRQVIDELKMKKGFIPDVIMVDYLQIMSSYRLPYSVGSYYYFKSVAEELRALAVETNTTIWSAAQFNRSQMSSTEVGMEGIAESAGIAHTADGMWAIVRTEELDQQNQLMVVQLKSRYANKAVKPRFVIGVDIDRQMLYGVDDDRSEKLTQPGGGGHQILNSTDLKNKFLGLNVD